MTLDLEAAGASLDLLAALSVPALVSVRCLARCGCRRRSGGGFSQPSATATSGMVWR
jgi:hypothetical protein